MNTALELAGVALAALLSENLVLVSCMGIGTHQESFQDSRQAIRTGLCLTLVMSQAPSEPSTMTRVKQRPVRIACLES